MSMSAQRVLIVEDDRNLARLLALQVRELGCNVEVCHDGTNGIVCAEGGNWNLIVLDVTLPGTNGIDVCRHIRGGGRYTPILMISGLAGERERALGLDSGADDFLAKPFGLLEFTSRVKATLRRTRYPCGDRRPPDVLRSGDLELDLEQRTVSRGGRMLRLTTREFDLLAHLMRHPRRAFTRAQLLNQVWDTAHDAFEHTVSSHINRLRSKLEPDPATPRHIVTVWGVGYRFMPDGSALPDGTL